MVDRKLEHYGGEFVENEDIPFETRDDYEEKTRIQLEEEEKKKQQELIKAQEEWMKPENPYLWDDFDD